MKFLSRAAFIAGFLLISLASTSVAQRYDHDEVILDSFKVPSGGLLTIDADMGSVVIEGGRGNEIDVTVIKGINNVSKSEAERAFDRYEVIFDETRNGLRIVGDYDKPRAQINWRKRLNVHYEIKVPSNIEVDIKTSGGSINVEDIAGDATLRTSGGSIQLADIDGHVTARTSGGSIKGNSLGEAAEVRTSGGSITLSDVNGWVKANTSGGGIKMAEIDGPVEARTSGGGIQLSEIAGAVNAKTSGGGIEAEIIGQPERDMHLQTSGGSVTVLLDRGVRANVDAKSSGGSVSTDFAVTIQGKKKRNKLQGEINGGGPMLTLRTSGGSVRIREN